MQKSCLRDLGEAIRCDSFDVIIGKEYIRLIHEIELEVRTTEFKKSNPLTEYHFNRKSTH